MARLDFKHDECRWMFGLGLWIESFHMPMFCLVSGHLSSGAFTSERAMSAFVRVGAPLLIITFSHGPDFILSFPWSVGPWFLVVWVMWRVTNPLITWMKPSCMFLTVMAASLLGGYWGMEQPYGKLPFHINEFFGFVPFYALGYLLPKELVEDFSARGGPSKRVKIYASVVLLVALIGYQVAAQYVSSPCLGTVHNLQWMGRRPYDWSAKMCYSIPYEWRWLTRLAIQVEGLLFGSAFMLLVPHETKIFSVWGQRTMYAYINQYQIYLVYHLVTEHIGSIWLPDPSASGWRSPFVILYYVVGLLLISLVLNAFLCCGPMVDFYKPVIEPTWLLALKNTTAPTAAEHTSIVRALVEDEKWSNSEESDESDSE